MAIELINILSAILAIGATIYLFITANKCEKELKNGFMLIAGGVLIALAAHSFVEALEAYGYLTIETLHTIMPILVLIGLPLLILGTYTIYKVVSEVSKK